MENQPSNLNGGTATPSDDEKGGKKERMSSASLAQESTSGIEATDVPSYLVCQEIQTQKVTEGLGGYKCLPYWNSGRPQWKDLSTLPKPTQNYIKKRLPILFNDKSKGDNLKVGTLLVFKPHKSPKLTFINDTLHGLYGTKNAIESKNIKSAGNFWSQANFVFKPIKIDESDILFELYSPYGGRTNLGIRGIDLDKEERRVYTFLEIMNERGRRALDLRLKYSGEGGTLTDMDNNRPIKFDTVHGGPVYSAPKIEPLFDNGVMFAIGPFVNKDSLEQLQCLTIKGN